MDGAWIVALVGLWVLASSLVGLAPSQQALNNWAIAAILAGTACLRLDASRGHLPGLAALGAATWLVLAGFRLSLLRPPGLYWNSLVVGLLLAVTGFLADQPLTTSQAARDHRV